MFLKTDNLSVLLSYTSMIVLKLVIVRHFVTIENRNSKGMVMHMVNSIFQITFFEHASIVILHGSFY